MGYSRIETVPQSYFIWDQGPDSWTSTVISHWVWQNTSKTVESGSRLWPLTKTNPEWRKAEPHVAESPCSWSKVPWPWRKSGCHISCPLSLELLGCIFLLDYLELCLPPIVSNHLMWVGGWVDRWVDGLTWQNRKVDSTPMWLSTPRIFRSMRIERLEDKSPLVFSASRKSHRFKERRRVLMYNELGSSQSRKTRVCLLT